MVSFSFKKLYELVESKSPWSGLTEDQRAAINELALAWDLPALNEANRTWLLHNLLQHAVSPMFQNQKYIDLWFSLM